MEEEFQRKKKGKAGMEAAGWESIYCSLILILVAFFAMLVSYATVEGEQSGTKTNYMRGWGADAMFEGSGKTSQGDATSLLATSGIEAIALTAKALQHYMKTTNLSQSASIQKTAEGLKIIFEDHILFSLGTAELNKDAYAHLDQITMMLKPHPFSIKVEGHTDDTPIHTSEFSSNWELSMARAVRVVRYLLKGGGIRVNRLEAIGCGSYNPIASNASVEGRKKNRRVEFHIKLEKDKRYVWQLIKNSFNSEGL